MLKYLWVENFDEIALSRMVKEIEGNLCFAIFGKKFENSPKWPPFLGIFENFLPKLAKIANCLRYSCNRAIERF